MGYIYIAWDKTKPGLSKIGMTTKSASSRISQTENPDYQLYKDYFVDDSEVADIEQKLHEKIGELYRRKIHLSTRRKSEWFECKPEQAIEIVSDYLIEILQRKLSKFEIQSISSSSYSPLNAGASQYNPRKLNELRDKLRKNAEARKSDAYEKEVHIRETIKTKGKFKSED